eukprot:6185865-Pleurochrysis_carterae.AAC.1
MTTSAALKRSTSPNITCRPRALKRSGCARPGTKAGFARSSTPDACMPVLAFGGGGTRKGTTMDC